MSEGSGIRKLLGERLGERFEKCVKWWTMAVAAIVATSGMVYGAYAQWESVRPWATRDDVAKIDRSVRGDIADVASDTYPLVLADQQTKTQSLKNRLEFLIENGKAGKNKPEQWLEIPVMKRLIRESEEQEAQIIKRMTKFQKYEEHR